MEGDANSQIAIVNDYVKQRVGGIALAPADPELLVPAVENAARQNVTMAIIDSGVHTEKYLTFVSTDNNRAGAAAADRFADQLPFGSSVAIIGGDPGTTASTERENGFREKLTKTYPGIKIVDFQYGLGNDEKAAQVAEAIFKANPGLGGLFCSNLSASLGAVKVAKAKGLAGKVKIVGFDVSPALVDELKAGNVNMIIARDPFRIAYMAVWTLFGHLKGHDPERRVNTAFKTITVDDLKQQAIQDILNPPLDKYLKKPAVNQPGSRRTEGRSRGYAAFRAATRGSGQPEPEHPMPSPLEHHPPDQARDVARRGL